MLERDLQNATALLFVIRCRDGVHSTRIAKLSLRQTQQFRDKGKTLIVVSSLIPVSKPRNARAHDLARAFAVRQVLVFRSRRNRHVAEVKKRGEDLPYSPQFRIAHATLLEALLQIPEICPIVDVFADDDAVSTIGYFEILWIAQEELLSQRRVQKPFQKLVEDMVVPFFGRDIDESRLLKEEVLSACLHHPPDIVVL